MFFTMSPTLEIVRRSSSCLSKTNEWSKTVLLELKELLCGNKLKQFSGVCLLHVVLEKCDSDVFEENATTWIRFMLQIANTVPSENILSLCLNNLQQIITKSVRYDKLNRDVGTKGIDTLLSFLIGPTISPLPSTYKLIESCITNYGHVCGRFRSGFEKLLLVGIEHHDKHIRSAAGQCFPSLALCGSSGEKRQKQIDSFHLLLKRVMKTAHHCLDVIVVEVTSCDTKKNEESGEIDILQFETAMESVDCKLTTYCNRLKNLFAVIRHFLSRSYPFVVEIPISLLMQLLCDVSNLPHLELRSIYQTDLAMKMYISKLLNGVLSCLTVCIRQLPSLLLPYYPVISKMVAVATSFRELSDRNEVYTCMYHIIEHWKALPDNATLLDEIIQPVLQDVSIVTEKEKHVIVEADLNKKKKKKLGQKLSQDIANKNRTSTIENFKAINSANGLKLLHRIVRNCGPVIPANTLKKIVACLVRTSTTLLAADALSKIPYNCKENVILLFKVVYSILALYHHSVPVPTSVLLSLFEQGAKYGNQDVSTYCQSCLYDCDRFLHGSQPCLRDYSEYSVDAENENNEVSHVSSSPDPFCASIQAVTQNSTQNLNEVTQNSNGATQNSNGATQNSNDATKNSNKATHESSTTKKTIAPEAMSPQKFASMETLPECVRKNPTSHVVEIQPVIKDLSRRVCKSADHVIREKQTPDLPRRPSSEPAVTCSGKVLCSPNNKRNDGTNDDAAVVISSGEEEDRTEDLEMISSRKRGRKSNTETIGDDVDLTVSKRKKVYSPSKENNNDIQKEHDGAVEHEVEAILRTFCEIEAD